MTNKQKIAHIIGLKLKQLREEKGLSQKEVAQAIDTDKSYIGHLESGVKFPSLKLVERLCVAYDIPYKYFFDDALSTNEIHKFTPKQKAILEKLNNKSEKQLDFVVSLLDFMESK